MKHLNLKQRGFTLIELVITMLIAAILAAVAVSLYSQSIIEARRTQAKTALMDLANREQKFYATNNIYSTTPSDLGYTGAQFPMEVGEGYYEVNVVVTPATLTIPASFSLTATPVGAQAKDTECVSFGLNNLGQQTAVNAAGQNTESTCW